MKTFTHWWRVLAGLDSPQTQVAADELTILLKYSSAAETIVEIGCFEGATAIALGGHTAGQVYSIDIFPRGRAGLCYGYWIAFVEIRRRGLKNIHLIKGFSHEVASKVDYAVDLLFIDGDHSDGGIQRDWSAWFPKVKVGGIIALHDCRLAPNSPSELGSTRFYRSCLTKLDTIAEVPGAGTLAVFRKLR